MSTKNTNNVEQPIAESNVQTETKKPKIQLNRYQVISIICASLLVALALAVGIYFIVKNSEDDKPPYTPPVVLTVENYNSITEGMTYEQVFAILGEGKRFGNNNPGELSYTWQDNGDRLIVVTFTAEDAQGGQGKVPGTVISKNQIGIIE